MPMIFFWLWLKRRIPASVINVLLINVIFVQYKIKIPHTKCLICRYFLRVV